MNESTAAPSSIPFAAGGFRPLLLVRVLTVVNDNLLRWLAIGLGKRAAGVAGTAVVLTIGTAGFVLPFVALAWLAGWLADRYPKRSVVAWSKFAELAIAAAAVGVLWWGSRPGEAFATWGRFGPAAAALLAVAAAGWLASLTLPRRPAADPAAPPPFNALARSWGDLREIGRSPDLLAAAAGIVFFWALGAVAQLNVDQLVEEGGGRSQAAAIPMLLALVVGIAAGSVAAGRISSRGADLGLVPLGAVIMAAASLALAIGPRTLFVAGAAVPAAWWTAVVALWTLGFGAGMFDVPLEAHFQAAAPPARRGALLAALNLLTFAGMLGASLLYGLLRAPADQPAAPLPPALWLLLGTVILIGCQAALLAPALIGSLAETVPARRLADANGSFALVTLVATLAGMAAGNWLADQPPAAETAAATAPLVSARGVFGIFAAASLAAAVVAVWAAPRASLRLFVAAIVHGVWRFRVRDEARVPLAGPLVMVANHVSWLDGFLLPLASPRPVRMVVYAPNIKGRFLNMLAGQWRFILFDPKPKSIGRALRAIQDGLAAGDCIGIFCEGGISRTGQIMGFKRGLEWLLARVESPILPVSIDGMWGSLLSFSEGRFFTKRPRGFRRPVTLTFGSALPVGTPTGQARLAIQELSARVVRRRLAGRRGPPGFGGDWPAACAEAEAFDGACLVRRSDRLLASLAEGDPLHGTLGTHGGRLLGIPAAVLDDAAPAGEIGRALAVARATIWLARVEQVEALAAAGPGAGGLAAHLAIVVMPLAAASALPRARRAAEAFRAAQGVEPVVAYCPQEAGCLVSMNTPSRRSPGDFEVTHRPDSLGRVVNGGVVWPRAAVREPLGLESLVAEGIAGDAAETLLVSALLPCPDATGSEGPAARLLADALDVDDGGFLVPRPA